MTSITIQLDDRTNDRLLELSRREHKKPEAIVADVMKRRLFSDVDNEASAYDREISRRLEAHRRGEGSYVTTEQMMSTAERRITETERKSK